MNVSGTVRIGFASGFALPSWASPSLTFLHFLEVHSQMLRLASISLLDSHLIRIHDLFRLLSKYSIDFNLTYAMMVLR
jgi:hypothetical protein